MTERDKIYLAEELRQAYPRLNNEDIEALIQAHEGSDTKFRQTLFKIMMGVE